MLGRQSCFNVRLSEVKLIIIQLLIATRVEQIENQIAPFQEAVMKWSRVVNELLACFPSDEFISLPWVISLWLFMCCELPLSSSAWLIHNSTCNADRKAWINNILVLLYMLNCWCGLCHITTSTTSCLCSVTQIKIKPFLLGPFYKPTSKTSGHETYFPSIFSLPSRVKHSTIIQKSKSDDGLNKHRSLKFILINSMTYRARRLNAAFTRLSNNSYPDPNQYIFSYWNLFL